VGGGERETKTTQFVFNNLGQAGIYTLCTLPSGEVTFALARVIPYNFFNDSERRQLRMKGCRWNSNPHEIIVGMFGITSVSHYCYWVAATNKSEVQFFRARYARPSSALASLALLLRSLRAPFFRARFARPSSAPRPSGPWGRANAPTTHSALLRRRQSPRRPRGGRGHSRAIEALASARFGIKLM
jgi:hypothetical protein